jgi:hypothetical protein
MMAAENEDNHDRFLRKNQALSRAYEISRKDKVKDKVVRGEQKPVVTLCYRCKKERPTMKYHIAETGRAEGAVSVSNEYVPLCEECAPKKKKSADELSPKQISSLLRGARHGRI